MRMVLVCGILAFALLVSAGLHGTAVAAPAAITPNEFEGTDSERINKAIAAAAATGQKVVIPKMNCAEGGTRDIWLLDSAILVQSGTTLELENCHIKLSDRCRDNFIRSANCGVGIAEIKPITDVHIKGVGSVLFEGADHPRATGDSAKTLGKRSYGTDAGVEGVSQTGDWRNIGILLAFVERFSIENICIKEAHCWSMSLERCAFGTVRDIDFAASEHRMIDGKLETTLNQDGLDLRQGCHDITIENITGHTGDDLVALTNIVGKGTAGTTESTMVSAANNRGNGLDDICNIILRNVRGCTKGGHHIVRFLNASGLKIHDIIFDGLIDTSGTGKQCKAALKIGDSNAVWGGVTPLGDTYRIFVSNIMSRAKHTVLIAGSLCDSNITNILKYEAPGDPITYASGKENVRNVEIINARTVTALAK